MENIHIRQLHADDWEAFRAVRLHALETEPHLFGSNYAKEAEYTPDVWQSRLSHNASATFGLFDGSHMVGITGIVPWSEDASGATAHFVMSFIKKGYRGKGFAGLFYNARINWAKHSKLYNKVTVGHRSGNTPVQKLNEKFGFKLIKKEEISWPDGTNDLKLTYSLTI